MVNVIKFSLFIALMALIPAVMSQVVFQPTVSMSHMFYIKDDGSIHKEDVVRFPMQHSLIMEGKKVSLLKRVKCMAGDTLVVDDKHWFYCNNQLISIANSDTDLPIFTFHGTIPNGKAFVLGDNPNSFDSRYYGLVDVAPMQKLTPVI